MPQLESLDWAPQLIWLAFTFAVLYILMLKVVLPRIGTVLENRANQISGDLEAAENLRRQTEEAIASYEQALAEAKQEAHAIVEKGRAKLKAQTDTERAKLENQLAEKSEQAEARIAKAKTAAMKEVNTVATDVAADIVQQLIGTAPPKGDVEKAVEAARKAQ